MSSDLTPLSSIQEGYLNKSQKQRSGKNSEKAPETHVKPVISTKLTAQQRRSTKYGLSKDSRFLRRSPRFFEGCNVKDNGNEESKDLSKTESVSEFPSKSDSGISRRVTRSFSRANKKEAVTGSVNRVIGSLAGEVENVLSKLDKEWVKSGANLSEQCLYKIEKRVTRSSSRGAELADIQKCGNEKGGRSIQLDSFECLDKGVLSHKGNGEVDNKLSKQCMREPVSRRKCNTSLPADPAEEGDRKGFDNEEEQDLVGMKKKRAEADQGHRVIQGWTREQEVALQRAYFAANPTPHFWKKVSKMVIFCNMITITEIVSFALWFLLLIGVLDETIWDSWSFSLCNEFIFLTSEVKIPSLKVAIWFLYNQISVMCLLTSCFYHIFHSVVDMCRKFVHYNTHDQICHTLY